MRFRTRVMSLAVVSMGTVWAQAPAAAQGVEESARSGDIVVTAMKREQNLLDVSASITAISADDLAVQRVTDVRDLSSSIPNVSIGDTLGIAQITIRGLGLDSYFVGGEPSVAMHVDGAVISRGEAQLGSLFDLERVEVLRGPSGTLYGRNATGGTINLITKRPTAEWEGYARATYGNYNNMEFEGAVGGPLADPLRIRVAYRRHVRDGFGFNEFTRTDVNDADRHSLRGHVQYIFSPTMDLLLSAEYHQEKDSNYIPTPLQAAFPNTQNAGLISRADFSSNPVRNLISDNEGRNDRKTWAVGGTFNWDVSDALSFKSLTNYREYEHHPSLDVSFNASPGTHAEQNLETKTFTQEFQFNYDSDLITAVAGLYYYREKMHGFNTACILTPGNCDQYDPIADQVIIPPAAPGVALYQNGFGTSTAYAVYGNFTIHVAPTFDVILGGRYSDESRKGKNVNSFVTAFPTPNFESTSTSVSRFDPFVGLEWRPMDGLMLYANYKSAYKAGVFFVGNVDPVTQSIIPILKPEIVKGFEAGIKGSFADDMVDVALAGFAYTIDDKQVSRSIPNPTNILQAIPVFQNAAGAKIEGVELEVGVMPTRGLRLSGTVGYLDARYTDFDTIDALQDASPNLTVFPADGNPLALSPKWSATGRFDYETPINDSVSVAFGAEALYKGTVQNFPFPSVVGEQKGYTLFNANIAFLFDIATGQRVSLNFWGRNLGDKDYFNSKLLSNGCRCIAGIAGPPRTYGVTAGFEF